MPRPAGHHRRRLEHRFPSPKRSPKSSRRRNPGTASRSAPRAPAAASRSSAATRSTSPTRRGRSRPTEIEACEKAGIEYIELPVAYDGLAVVVNPKNTWATSMTVAELKKLWEPGRAGQDHALEPGARRLAGPGNSSVRRRRRLRHLRLLHRGDQRKGRRAAATTPRARTTTSSCRASSGDQYALGYFGYAYYEENKDKLKLVADRRRRRRQRRGPDRAVAGDREERHLSSAVAADLHLCEDQGARAARSAAVRRLLSRRRASPLVREVGYVPLTRQRVGARAQPVHAPRRPARCSTGADSHSQVTLEQRLTR